MNPPCFYQEGELGAEKVEKGAGGRGRGEEGEGKDQPQPRRWRVHGGVLPHHDSSVLQPGRLAGGRSPCDGEDLIDITL